MRRGIRSKVSSFADGLINIASGLGTLKSKRSHNRFAYQDLGNWQELDAAYQTNWIARRIVDAVAEDMTREWRTIHSTMADDIRLEEDRLRVHNVVNEALSWARLYGGAGVLMLTGQPLDKPLNVSAIKKGGLERLEVFDRFYLSAMSINTSNVMAANFLQPEFYVISGGSQKIHWSHIARFEGARLPRRQRLQTQGWGDSELRKCLDDIMDVVASKNGIAELMQEANIDVITREGLTEDISTDQEDKIISRYAVFSQMKSIINLALLDGDEKLDRLTLNLSGVAPIIEQFIIWICGASGIPMTRLFGTSAQGLNATGAGDEKVYYDSIRASQAGKLDPPMSVIDQVLVRSALGFIPDDYNYDWNPLYQPNRKEESEANKVDAETAQIYLDMGAITVSQVMRKLQTGEVYQFNDEDIEELEAAESAGLGLNDDA